MRQRVSREQNLHLCAWGLATQDSVLEVQVRVCLKYPEEDWELGDSVDSTETRDWRTLHWGLESKERDIKSHRLILGSASEVFFLRHSWPVISLVVGSYLAK